MTNSKLPDDASRERALLAALGTRRTDSRPEVDKLGDIDDSAPHLYFSASGNEFVMQLDRSDDNPNAFFLTDDAQARFNEVVRGSIRGFLREMRDVASQMLLEEKRRDFADGHDDEVNR